MNYLIEAFEKLNRLNEDKNVKQQNTPFIPDDEVEILDEVRNTGGRNVRHKKDLDDINNSLIENGNAIIYKNWVHQNNTKKTNYTNVVKLDNYINEINNIIKENKDKDQDGRRFNAVKEQNDLKLEGHHIKIFCCGGSNTKLENFIFLTHEQHVHVHKTLADDNPGIAPIQNAYNIFLKMNTKSLTREEQEEINRAKEAELNPEKQAEFREAVISAYNIQKHKPKDYNDNEYVIQDDIIYQNELKNFTLFYTDINKPPLRIDSGSMYKLLRDQDKKLPKEKNERGLQNCDFGQIFTAILRNTYSSAQTIPVSNDDLSTLKNLYPTNDDIDVDTLYKVKLVKDAKPNNNAIQFNRVFKILQSLGVDYYIYYKKNNYPINALDINIKNNLNNNSVDNVNKTDSNFNFLSSSGNICCYILYNEQNEQIGILNSENFINMINSKIQTEEKLSSTQISDNLQNLRPFLDAGGFYSNLYIKSSISPESELIKKIIDFNTTANNTINIKECNKYEIIKGFNFDAYKKQLKKFTNYPKIGELVYKAINDLGIKSFIRFSGKLQAYPLILIPRIVFKNTNYEIVILDNNVIEIQTGYNPIQGQFELSRLLVKQNMEEKFSYGVHTCQLKQGKASGNHKTGCAEKLVAAIKDKISPENFDNNVSRVDYIPIFQNEQDEMINALTTKCYKTNIDIEGTKPTLLNYTNHIDNFIKFFNWAIEKKSEDKQSIDIQSIDTPTNGKIDGDEDDSTIKKIINNFTLKDVSINTNSKSYFILYNEQDEVIKILDAQTLYDKLNIEKIDTKISRRFFVYLKNCLASELHWTNELFTLTQFTLGDEFYNKIEDIMNDTIPCTLEGDVYKFKLKNCGKLGDSIKNTSQGIFYQQLKKVGVNFFIQVSINLTKPVYLIPKIILNNGGVIMLLDKNVIEKQKTAYDNSLKFKSPQGNQRNAKNNLGMLTDTKILADPCHAQTGSGYKTQVGCADKLYKALFSGYKNEEEKNKFMNNFKHKVQHVWYIPIYQEKWEETSEAIKQYYNYIKNDGSLRLNAKLGYTDSIDKFIEYINKDDSNTNQKTPNTNQQDNKTDKTKHYDKTKK